MHCIELPYASHNLIFLKKHSQASKLGGGLAIYPMTIGGHTCLNHFSQRPYTVFMKIVTG